MKRPKIFRFLSFCIALLLLVFSVQAQAQTIGGVYLPLVLGKPLPPPSGQVVFASDRDGDQEIYHMNYDGSDVTQLTFNTGFSDVNPDWSPDGQQIAYVSNLTGTAEIYIMGADGGNQIRLTELGNCYTPAWSPDGTKIAFRSRQDNNNLIFTMDPDGDQLTQITESEISGHSPYWSPDGLTIAFLSSRIPPGLYTIDAAGLTEPVLVLEHNFLDAMAWSPDGEQFAVVLGDPDTFSFDVYLYDLDTGTTTRLTDNLLHSAAVDWYPLGNYLIFMSDLNYTDFEVYTMTTTGTQITNLTNNPAYDASPDWIPGGSP